MKMGLNGSAMGPHGLILDEDGAISCPMPLDALPTPFKKVLNHFDRFWLDKALTKCPERRENMSL